MDTAALGVVELPGEWDTARQGELRQRLAATRNFEIVILDFTACRYLDSSTLNELVRMRKDRAAKGLPSEWLVAPNDTIRRILGIVQFDRIFQVCETIEQARRGCDMGKRSA